jgi:heme/copper-type cytochrome/quinol oxidase subunit 2
MNTNGFSREKYDGSMFFVGLLIPIVLIAIVISTYIIARMSADRIEDDVAIALIGRTAIIIVLIGILIGTLIVIITKRACKVYAGQVIDHPDDDPIVDIDVSDEYIEIDCEEKSEVKAYIIRYDEYWIRVKYRRNFTTPVFYIKNGVITRVVIPYSKDKDQTWDKYKVRH